MHSHAASPGSRNSDDSVARSRHPVAIRPIAVLKLLAARHVLAGPAPKTSKQKRRRHVFCRGREKGDSRAAAQLGPKSCASLSGCALLGIRKSARIDETHTACHGLVRSMSFAAHRRET
ncbi:hypothetical protein MRX96_051653 [Rhipicephalus microplus]